MKFLVQYSFFPNFIKKETRSLEEKIDKAIMKLFAGETEDSKYNLWIKLHKPYKEICAELESTLTSYEENVGSLNELIQMPKSQRLDIKNNLKSMFYALKNSAEDARIEILVNYFTNYKRTDLQFKLNEIQEPDLEKFIQEDLIKKLNLIKTIKELESSYQYIKTTEEEIFSDEDTATFSCT